MAFGRDIEQDKADAAAMRRRRTKQRGYQERYRKRLIVEGIPERDAMGDGLLVGVLNVCSTNRNTLDKLIELGIFRAMFDNLVQRGANRKAAMKAFGRMLDRWAADADRDRREAEMEAAYQARLAGGEVS